MTWMYARVATEESPFETLVVGVGLLFFLLVLVCQLSGACQFNLNFAFCSRMKSIWWQLLDRFSSFFSCCFANKLRKGHKYTSDDEKSEA